MERNSYKLTDADIAAFIPYVLLKIGDTKDVIRTLCRQVVNQSTIISSSEKMFSLLTDALNTKNYRQKTECLALCETFLGRFAITICSNNSVSSRHVYLLC